jgi:hypothetical protein
MICVDNHGKGGKGGQGSSLRQPCLAQPVENMFEVLRVLEVVIRFKLSL